MQTFIRKVKEKPGNNNIYKTKHKFLSQLAEGPSATLPNKSFVQAKCFLPD